MENAEVKESQLDEGFPCQCQVLDRALQTTADGAAIWRPQIEAAGNLQQIVVAGVMLQLPPQFIGSQQQRQIAGVLVIRLPNNPGCTVRGSMTVRRFELVKSDDIRSARGELIHSGSANAAQANHDRIHRLVHWTIVAPIA